MSLNPWLMAATVANVVAGLMHLACIALGGPWYRFMGAGEDMVRMAESGRWLPHLLSLAITLVLFGWASYTWAGAGWGLPLPSVSWVILAITAVYLLRGVIGFFINAQKTGRSQAFWWWSSSICLAIGILHAIGLGQVWHRL